MQYQAETMYMFVMFFVINISGLVNSFGLSSCVQRFIIIVHPWIAAGHLENLYEWRLRCTLRGFGPEGAQAGRGSGQCASVLRDGPFDLFIRIVSMCDFHGCLPTWSHIVFVGYAIWFVWMLVW